MNGGNPPWVAERTPLATFLAWCARTASLSRLRNAGDELAWTFGDQAVVSGANFSTGIIIARASTQEQFGLYVLAFYAIMAAIELQTSLISYPYTVIRPRLQPQEAPTVNVALIVWQSAYALAVAVALAAAAAVANEGYGPPGLPSLLAALAALAPCMLLREHLRRVALAELRARAAFSLNALVSLLQIAILIGLTMTVGLSALGGVVAAAAASGVVSVAWLFSFQPKWRVDWTRTGGLGLCFWQLGRWMAAGAIVSQFTAQLFPWLLAGFAGSASTAVWAACAGLTAIFNPALLGLANYLTPAAASAFAVGGHRGLRRMARRTALLYLAVMTPLSFALLLGGEQIVAFLYGPAYAGIGSLVALVVLTLLPNGLSIVYSRGLYAFGRADIDFRSNLLPLAAGVAAGIWLIQPYGLIGAGAAALAGNTAAAAARFLSFRALAKRHA